MKNIFVTVVISILTLPGMLLAQSLRINEVMPNNNAAHFDDFGEAEDWLEIYNTTSADIQLSDYYISNDFSQKLRWQLPSTILGAGDMMLIYCSGRDIYSPEPHANFKLKNQTDTVGIFYKDGSTVDVFVYQKLQSDISYGCLPNGSNTLKYFDTPTPGATNNNSTGYACVLDKPVVNVQSGFYASPLNLTVTHTEPGVELRFSTKGEDPLPTDMLYTNALSLTTDYSANRLSLVPTNPGLVAPVGFYNENRRDNRGWLAPAVDVGNVNVFRVKAYKAGCIMSETVSKTYFLNDGSINFSDLPIISLQTDSAGFFSDPTGIYVYGDSPNANYRERGEEWERPMYMEYFDEAGNRLIGQNVGGELHGNGSRHSTQKNIRVSAKSIYGKSTIEADLFDNYDVNSFKYLIVRSPGHRPDCMPRDELATAIGAKLGFDIQHYKIGLMYLNGEYWGIHNLKERFNEDFISIKYDLSKDDIVLLEGDGVVENGNDNDTIHYFNMIEFVEQNDLDIPQNMAYLNTQMDIDNYINLISSEVYIGNGDWPTNNMRFWRKRVAYDDYASIGHDGRWRWMYYDLDGAFGGTCADVYYAINNLERALDTSSSYFVSTRLFRALTSHESFKEMYINQSCDLLNSSFLASVTGAKLDTIVNDLNPVMMDHVNRWGYPSVSTTLVDRMAETPSLTKWNYLVSRFEVFTERRHRFVYEHMQEQWSLLDTSSVEMNVNNTQMGYVQLNTLHIDENLEGVNPGVYPWEGTYFEGIDIPIHAHAYPGYRFVEWLGTGMTSADTVISINGDTSFTAVFEIDPNYVPPLPITINEIQASNSTTVFDEQFEYDDWIELYNPNPTSVDITNYYLTDNEANLTKYQIAPNQTVMEPYQYMVFWADGQTGQGQNHTNFKLSAAGEMVALVAADGVTVIDSIRFGSQQTDDSYGRQTDGQNPWIVFAEPTPFYSNLLTSTEDIAQAHDMEVYPNPVSNGRIYINAKISGAIYNISGVMVKQFTHQNSVDVSNLVGGVYILRNEVSGESLKIIIQ